MNTPLRTYNQIREIQDALLEMAHKVSMDDGSDNAMPAIDKAWNHLEEARQIVSHLETKDKA